MVLMKKLKVINDALLDSCPDLKDALKPNDQYPELIRILKKRPINFPIGSINTKVIINDGEIVERIFKAPNGQVFSLFPKVSNLFLDQVA